MEQEGAGEMTEEKIIERSKLKLIKRFENWLEKKGEYVAKYRKTFTVILIISLLIFSSLFAWKAFDDTGYETIIPISLTENFKNVNNDNGSIDIWLDIWTDGPVTPNNKIYPLEINIFLYDADEWKVDRLELYFFMASSSKSITFVSEDFTQFNSTSKSIPLNYDDNNCFLPTITGSKQISMQARLFIDGVQYNSTVFGLIESNTYYDIVIVEDSGRYAEYINLRWATTSIVLAAVAFSVPSTIKITTELFWGKNYAKNDNKLIKELKE